MVGVVHEHDVTVFHNFLFAFELRVQFVVEMAQFTPSSTPKQCYEFQKVT